MRMSPHAREPRTARASAARRALALLACALAAAVALLLGSATVARAAADGSLQSRSDAQLANAAGALEAEATAIGEQLLRSASRREEVEREREVAERLLQTFMREAYKQQVTNGSTAQQLLESGSLAEAADQLRVADALGGYHANVLRSMQAAEGRLDVTRVERARLITRLGALQARLVDVQAEQSRRATIRATHQAARDRRAAERAAAAAQRTRDAAAAIAPNPGTLVGAPAPGFIPAGMSPTAAMLDAYLAGKGSPMAGQGAAFMASGARWSVDPRLLVAIAGAESNFGSITCGPHNAWGWACPNDPADFGTWADGIDTVTRGLRNYYLDEGRTSVSLIQQKYCPVGAANDPTGLNSHWTDNVTKFLTELGGNPASVGPGPSGAGALQMPGFGIMGD